jgi:hypothetical protein
MNKISNLLKSVELRLIKEIENEDLNWRILRISTVIDLLISSYLAYEKMGERRYLKNMMLWILRAKVIYRLGNVKIDQQNTNQLINDIKAEQVIILQNFESVMIAIRGLKYNSVNNLHSEVEYLKTISRLELDNLDETILDTVFLNVVIQYIST